MNKFFKLLVLAAIFAASVVALSCRNEADSGQWQPPPEHASRFPYGMWTLKALPEGEEMIMSTVHKTDYENPDYTPDQLSYASPVFGLTITEENKVWMISDGVTTSFLEFCDVPISPIEDDKWQFEIEYNGYPVSLQVSEREGGGGLQLVYTLYEGEEYACQYKQFFERADFSKKIDGSIDRSFYASLKNGKGSLKLPEVVSTEGSNISPWLREAATFDFSDDGKVSNVRITEALIPELPLIISTILKEGDVVLLPRVHDENGTVALGIGFYNPTPDGEMPQIQILEPPELPFI